jgi:anti-sigma28 factor (negative regulator of flagellin synthesis)
LQNSKIGEVTAKLKAGANAQIIRAGEPMRRVVMENLKQVGAEKLDKASIAAIKQAIKDGKIKVKP